MRHPAQGATGGWVMPGLVFMWFPLYEFSLFETLVLWSLGSWSQGSHSKERLRALSSLCSSSLSGLCPEILLLLLPGHCGFIGLVSRRHLGSPISK